MAGFEAVKIVGLRELQRDLRDLDKKLPRELRKVNLSVAQMVAEKAQGTASGVSPMAAAAAQSLKATAQQRNAALVLKVNRGFELGAEFGAGRNIERNRKTGSYQGFNQFMAWRGNDADAGYFMYPTVREENEHIVDMYVQRLTELLNRVYPD